MMFKLSTAGFALYAVLAPGAFAQVGSVYADIGPCMAMGNDNQRYACYDLLEEQIRAAQARQTELPAQPIPRNPLSGLEQARTEPVQEAAQMPDVPEGQSSVQTDASTVIEDFGLAASAAANSKEAAATLLENGDGSQELVDTITKLDEPVFNQWQVTLSSGQVWQQINSKRYRLREGMEVRIYLSPFGGSFRLSAANLNGFIQVRRVH